MTECLKRFPTLAAITLTAALISGPAGVLRAKDFVDSEIKHIVYPDWFSDNPFSDLSEDLENVRSAGKQGLMVLFTTQGCSYCHLFVTKSLGDPGIAARVRQNFESIGLEIFDDREMTAPDGVAMPIKQFADREGAEFAPTLLFFDLNGQRILKVVGYQSPERFTSILDYLTGGYFRTQSLGQYFASLAEGQKTGGPDAASGLRQDPLLGDPPASLDRSQSPAEKPLLLIFETRECRDCDQFHDSVLADPQVRETLEQFETVRLDADDEETVVIAPDGHRTSPAAWFEETDFTRTPALMFFDESGTLVLQTDALVLQQRMMNSLNFVLERAYEKGWTYQRFARSKALERWQKRQELEKPASEN